MHGDKCSVVACETRQTARASIFVHACCMPNDSDAPDPRRGSQPCYSPLCASCRHSRCSAIGHARRLCVSESPSFLRLAIVRLVDEAERGCHALYISSTAIEHAMCAVNVSAPPRRTVAGASHALRLMNGERSREAALQRCSRARTGGHAARPGHSRLVAAAVLALFSSMGPAAAQTAAAAPGGPSGNRTAPVLAPVAAPKGSPGPLPSPGAGVQPSPSTLRPAPAPAAVLTPGPSSGTISAPVTSPDPTSGASPVPSPSPQASPAGSKSSGGGPSTLSPPTSSPSATVVGGRLRGVAHLA